MKVILLQELKGKGGEGDVVDVAPGFANNYLLPQKVAILATKGNLKQLEQRKHNIAKREENRLADAGKIKETLDGALVKVEHLDGALKAAPQALPLAILGIETGFEVPGFVVIAEQDVLGQWITGALTPGAGWTQGSSLYAAYREFAGGQGIPAHRIETATAFGRALRKAGFHREHRTAGSVWDATLQQYRGSM